MLETDFKEYSSRIESTKNNAMVRFYLTSKFSEHQNMVPYEFRS